MTFHISELDQAGTALRERLKESLQAYKISTRPQLITFVLTRNQRLVESRVYKKLTEQPNLLDYFGVCFGKFNYIFEIRPETPELGFDFLSNIRLELFKSAPWFVGSFLSLLCFPVNKPKAKRKMNPSLPFRTYSVLRVLNNETSDLFKALSEVRSRFSGIQAELLWNPSLLSYVVKMASDNYDHLCKSLISIRIKAPQIRDCCTFMTISKNSLDDGGKNAKVQGTINVKLSDFKLINEMLQFPKTKVRLGYFDVTRDVTRSSPQLLLKEIKRMRRQFKLSDPPNWTGTVLTFEKPFVQSEIAHFVGEAVE